MKYWILKEMANGLLLLVRGDKMNRFFVDEKNIVDQEIFIDNEDVKHIKNVLRLKVDDEIEVVAKGMVYRTLIKNIESRKVILSIIESKEGQNEAPIDIYLYQGIAKGSKMDMILQKATEIGVKRIYPIETIRTVVKLKGDKKVQSRIERWNQITLESSKQSKRDEIPRVENILDFKELIEHLREAKFAIVPYELEDINTFKAGLAGYDGSESIHIIIGPEGGFDQVEIDQLIEIGVKPVTLGPRILRTETAGIVASTMALYDFGDLGVR